MPGVCRQILAARDRLTTDMPALADEASPLFGLQPSRLLNYWGSVRYDFTEAMADGLRRFLGYAADLGVIAGLPEIRFYSPEA